MQQKRGVFHYMQKIRFFAVFLLPVLLFGGPKAAAAQTSAGLPAPSDRSVALTLPEHRSDPAQIRELIPGGDVIAVRLQSRGVIVLGFSDESKDNPARKAGLKRGDCILKIGETEITGNESMAEALNGTGGGSVCLKYARKDKEYETTVTPRQEDGKYWQIGVLIKDATAGIGTLTYIVPGTGEYGSLGHGISDPDTETLFRIGRGSLYPAQITAVRRGAAGAPGELQGMFGTEPLGICERNCITGLFGVLDSACLGEREAVPVGDKSEIREGPATIRCTLDDGGIREYSIEIVRIYRTFGGATKNMLLRITDEALLAKTGGIVQGMSGSPILQNGKLVGAVTHVLINDPTSGYGIFIENMLTQMGDLAA